MTRSIRAIVVRADDDTAHEVTITPDMDTLQRLVGGFFQVIPVGRIANMWLNEDGKLNGLPRNENADAILAGAGQKLLPGDFIVGDVVITGPTDEYGDETSVSNLLRSIVEGAGLPIDAEA